MLSCGAVGPYRSTGSLTQGLLDVNVILGHLSNVLFSEELSGQIEELAGKKGIQCRAKDDADCGWPAFLTTTVPPCHHTQSSFWVRSQPHDSQLALMLFASKQLAEKGGGGRRMTAW